MSITSELKTHSTCLAHATILQQDLMHPLLIFSTFWGYNFLQHQASWTKKTELALYVLEILWKQTNAAQAVYTGSILCYYQHFPKLFNVSQHFNLCTEKNVYPQIFYVFK